LATIEIAYAHTLPEGQNEENEAIAAIAGDGKMNK